MMRSKREKKNPKQESCSSTSSETCSSATQETPPPPDQQDTAPTNNNNSNVTFESVYQFYKNNLFPAIMSSLPLLAKRIVYDTAEYVKIGSRKFVRFLLPKWSQEPPDLSFPNFGRGLWQHSSSNSSIAEFMLRHFDTNKDGHISSAELLNMTEIMKRSWPHAHPETWWAWFSREWPLMDWKVGVFLWRTFGGIIFLLAILSIVPGRMHAIAGKILRWPVLALTYFLVTVELMVYVVIRVVIRVAEYLVARPKHRKLRRQMAQATSYEEWYSYASELDKSQKRDRWLQQVDDDTSYRYNWGFIQELMIDMRKARAKGDSLLALAVIQQCTRKNVGGVMSEDLFSYSNTGEPKAIVREFIDEVVKTLHWITDEAVKVPTDDERSKDDSSEDIQYYEERFQRKVRGEKDKLWKSLIQATIHFLDPAKGKGDATKKSKQRLADDVSVDSTFSEELGEKENNNDAAAAAAATKRAPSKSLPSFHREQVLAFLKRARAAYGRTALCLSGGAMMGLYHFGVVSALLENGILPHIISGTSAGSVVGAILCTRTDGELKIDLNPTILAEKLICFSRPWKERIKSVMKNGNLFDFGEWLDLIKWFTRDDMTFLEAYRRTGRIFCITLSSTSAKSPPVLLNYLSAPDVTIASAVVASAAVPGFIPPVRLQVKDDNGVVRNQGGEKEQTFWDGSIQQDIPTQGLAEMLNCQFFVASQCNPHIVPFFYNPKGGVGRPSRWSSGIQEESWRGGFLLAALQMYLKNDMISKHVFLNDLEAAVGFTSTMMIQQFEGSTTIVPQVRFTDYFRLFANPRLHELYHYFQAGAVAAYEHTVMVKLHYSIADAVEDCIAKLESDRRLAKVQKRTSFATDTKKSKEVEGQSGSIDSMVAGLLRETREHDGPTVLSAASDSDDDDEDEYESLVA